ncbi:hypothetical protein KOR42_24990 [Thalassoglobus neptunius]|uniref:Uncharacterized protein n=1 Tax=Thalassoglobus neptunius TaxID=1938619 RepID=A0A5C5X861_9PLAN|nr:hypothetical protein [Thalassoglobus neptunius]TWT59110.1 hypothetical protein KOR42_24990 [Thalassoglobus neptunius]
MSEKFPEKWFRPLYGHPCWGIEYGRQTNLSINFGKPSLEIREPFVTESQSQVVRELASRRLVTVRGEWWLWLWCCYWKLTLNEETLATGSSSARRTKKAMSRLSGQKIVSLSVNEKTGFSGFEFDLGCQLSCRRFERDSEERLWSLYRPNGYVLSVHGNGTYCHQRSTDSELQRNPIGDVGR